MKSIGDLIEMKADLLEQIAKMEESQALEQIRVNQCSNRPLAYSARPQRSSTRGRKEFMALTPDLESTVAKLAEACPLGTTEETRWNYATSLAVQKALIKLIDDGPTFTAATCRLITLLREREEKFSCPRGTP